MTSPTATTRFRPFKQVFQIRSNPLPLMTRRSCAWAAEVSLILASALVPFSMGLYAQSHFSGKPVPINPILASAEKAIAKTFALPVPARPKLVNPLANLFWSGALAMPLLMAGWQIYLLGKTGQTLPKRWFGLQVVTASGSPPGLKRVLLREVVGHWGFPLSLAYLFWRYSGAVPDLGILTGLAGLMLLADACSGWFDSDRRTLHDRLAGTYVLDAEEGVPKFKIFDSRRNKLRDASGTWNSENEDAAIAALVLSRESKWPRPGLFYWMRQNPGLTLLMVGATAAIAILGTFAGTQVYVQNQINWRQQQQQENDNLLTLVSKFARDERQGAILALGSLDRPDAALQLLADLLSLETDAKSIEAISQAMVSSGPKALPYLQRLNQSLNNDQDSLRYGGQKEERQEVAQRLRASQRAIAKILTLYTDRVRNVDLSRINLAQTASGAGQFTLVLDYADLSGIQLKGALLSNGSFREIRFSDPGEDGLFGTYDDAIADLSGADFKEANLAGAFLSQVVMNRANLIRVNLNKANLSRAHLSGANLSSAQLKQADLGRAILNNASLTGADLQQANLASANLQNVRAGQVKASGANLRSANLSQSEWQEADLSEANLSGSNLQNADLSSARLVDANLRGTQLQHANFRNADLSTADLRGAKLAGADFQGAIFVVLAPRKPDQFIEVLPVSTPSNRFQGVDFTLAKNLNVKQITYICAEGGLHPKCALPER